MSKERPSNDWLDDYSGRSMHFRGEVPLSDVICAICGKVLTIAENNDECHLPVKERKCEEHAES
jgi:hypothetical protein